VFEESLRRLRIDYNIVGGFSFYERAEVKDIVAYLKLVLNPDDDIALLRVINVPPRGLGKTSLDELQFRAKDLGVSLWEAMGIIADREFTGDVNLTNRAKEAMRAFRRVIENLQKKAEEASRTEKPVTDLVIAAIDDSGYSLMLRSENSDEAEARLENLEELVNAAADYDKTPETGIRDFIDHAALVSDTDKFDRNASVTLMTVHSAKGLEFPIVFLVGLEDGIFPHSRSIGDQNELEEERRLAYVAITRAEKLLYITHSMRRRVYGEEIAAEPSQFLNEMPLELIHDLSYGSSWLSYARSGQENVRSSSAAAWSFDIPERPKNRNLYTGKTYNSADAIAEFFAKKNSPKRHGATDKPEAETRPVGSVPQEKPRSAETRPAKTGTPNEPKGLVPGSHVRHEKYGRGLVLRREGSGDNVKLTISFPGFGQKKLIEKYAKLEKA
jgi:DNA helicase-2/ATP-dependent DNA helicase PcrA